jgi:Uncharacterized protein conserved in bacteria (DUF2188)
VWQGEPMSKGDVHTLPRQDGRANEIECSRRFASMAAKKAEAQAKGREMATGRKVEHVIHNKDGTTQAQQLRGRSAATDGVARRRGTTGRLRLRRRRARLRH